MPRTALESSSSHQKVVASTVCSAASPALRQVLSDNWGGQRSRHCHVTWRGSMALLDKGGWSPEAGGGLPGSASHWLWALRERTPPKRHRTALGGGRSHRLYQLGLLIFTWPLGQHTSPKIPGGALFPLERKPCSRTGGAPRQQTQTKASSKAGTWTGLSRDSVLT